MKQPSTYYLSFEKLQTINTTLFSIYREYLAKEEFNSHHDYFKAWDLISDFIFMFGHEKSIILKAHVGDIDSEIKALRKALDSTQTQIQLLRLICGDDQLEALNKLDHQLLLIRRDMHNDAKKLALNDEPLAGVLKALTSVTNH